MTSTALDAPSVVEPDAGVRAARARGLRVAAALGSGVTVALCFPPADLGPLVLVALVPLLWAWRGARPAAAAGYGFLFGVACYGLTIEWIRYFGVVAFVALVGAMAAAIAVVGVLVALLGRRGLTSPVFVAAAWVLLEALRGRWPLGGFPWCDLGVTLHDVPAARALASFGGTLLVSFVIVLVNGYLLDLAVAARRRRGRMAAGAATALVVVIVLTAAADAARFVPTVTGHLRVAVLQGDDRELPLAQQLDQRLTTTYLRLADRLHGRDDLVVFPESALDTNPETDPALRRRLVAIAAAHDASLLVNARRHRRGGGLFNTNFLYEPDGHLQGTYAKQHLVPFGEYVPWRSSLGFLPQLRDIPYDFRAGHTQRVFHVAGHRVATVVCFESAFAPLVRDAVRDGAEMLVVSTNNRSYRRSANSEQHLALAQMRAAETARPVVQASLSGMSAVVDASGDVHDRTGLFETAIVRASVATTTGETPYVRYGDWIVVLSAALLLGAAIVVTVRAPRRGGPDARATTTSGPSRGGA